MFPPEAPRGPFAISEKIPERLIYPSRVATGGAGGVWERAPNAGSVGAMLRAQHAPRVTPPECGQMLAGLRRRWCVAWALDGPQNTS